MSVALDAVATPMIRTRVRKPAAAVRNVTGSSGSMVYRSVPRLRLAAKGGDAPARRCIVDHHRQALHVCYGLILVDPGYQISERTTEEQRIFGVADYQRHGA